LRDVLVESGNIFREILQIVLHRIIQPSVISSASY
jgi:hypothetical protein